jgi:hypothetical protein
MAKIPIKHAIKSGFWLKCDGSFDWDGQMIDYSFRIRILGFIKVNLKEIDNPQKINPKYDLTAGDFWLLKLEVVNFCKQQVYGTILRKRIILLDNEDFEFQVIDDEGHLRLHSDFADKSGLRTFYSINFIPKIKHSGSHLFFLPSDDSAQYFISVTGGEICEV